jgi:hypothetical protein
MTAPAPKAKQRVDRYGQTAEQLEASIKKQKALLEIAKSYGSGDTHSREIEAKRNNIALDEWRLSILIGRPIPYPFDESDLRELTPDQRRKQQEHLKHLESFRRKK